MTQDRPPPRWLEPWTESLRRMARLPRLETLPADDTRTLPEWAWLLGALAGLLTHDTSSLAPIVTGLLAAPMSCLLASPSRQVDGVLKVSSALPVALFAGAFLLGLQVLIPAWVAFHVVIWMAGI